MRIIIEYDKFEPNQDISWKMCVEFQTFPVNTIFKMTNCRTIEWEHCQDFFEGKTDSISVLYSATFNGTIERVITDFHNIYSECETDIYQSEEPGEVIDFSDDEVFENQKEIFLFSFFFRNEHVPTDAKFSTVISKDEIVELITVIRDVNFLLQKGEPYWSSKKNVKVYGIDNKDIPWNVDKNKNIKKAV